MPKFSGRGVLSRCLKSRFIHCPNYLFTKLVYSMCKNNFSNTAKSLFSRLFSTSNFSYLTSSNNGFYTLSTVLTIKTIKLNTLLLI
jgi:hypothetical protein